MKLLTWLVSASMFLNFYLLWRLDEPLRVSATTHSTSNTAPTKSTHLAIKDPSEKDKMAPLKIQITELASQIKALEQSYEALIVDSEKFLDVSKPYSEAKKVIESFEHISGGSVTNEEWFWTEEGEGEISLSFKQIDGFSVNSVVCRSDWCRVEVENTESDSHDLISDLELQLKINESLGRDTVIRSGERNGAHRVLFVQ